MNLADYVKATTQAAFAEALGVSQGLVSQWVNGQTTVTVARAREIVRATGGQVTAHELLPKVFPVGFEFPPEAAPEPAREK